MKQFRCTLHIKVTYEVNIEAESEDDLKKKLQSEDELVWILSDESMDSLDLDFCVIDEVREGESE